MTSDAPSYHGYRFPADIIAHAVWLYYRFSLSFRDVEDLLAQRGITVTYETIRQWCRTFGQTYARRLRRRRGQQGDTWHLDELFVSINGRLQYLWRAVDEDGDVRLLTGDQSPNPDGGTLRQLAQLDSPEGYSDWQSSAANRPRNSVETQ